MKKRWLILIMLIATSVAAQESKEDKTIEASTEVLQKANQKVQRSLEKLEKKLTRSFTKRYPELPKGGIDSLVQADLTAGALAKREEGRDTVASYLGELRERILADLQATPPNLPIAKELLESARHLERLKEMQAYLKKSGTVTEALKATELQALSKEAGALKAAFAEYKQLFAGWEEKLLSEVTSLEAIKLAKAQMDKMKAYQPLPEGYRSQVGQFQTNSFIKEKLEEKAEELKKTATESLQSKFDQAQSKMAEAKQKFPDLESVEEAPKRYNPYKGQPFFKRLKPGGDLQVNRERPASIDIAASLVYPLSLKASVGLAGATRIFMEESGPAQAQEGVLNFRAFSRYRFLKSFYFQGNYELSCLSNSSGTDTALPQKWVKNALVGIGKEVKVTTGIQMNITAFYDFFYDRQNSPNSQPWVFRMGFSFQK